MYFTLCQRFEGNYINYICFYFHVFQVCNPFTKTVDHVPPKKAQGDEKKVQRDVQKCPDFAITHDGWTSANTDSYNTVTGHFITPEWELKSVVLETKRVEGSHTAENIASSLRETQQAWSFVTPTAVTDNAPNEKKALELLQWVRFGCYGHRINLVVKKCLEVPEVSRLCAKGRKLVTFFHQSSSTTNALKVKQKLLLSSDAVGHKLINDVPTRWNSTLAMLSRLGEQTPALLAMASDGTLSKAAATTIKNCVYNFEEHHLAERLIMILDPFQKVTTIAFAE